MAMPVQGYYGLPVLKRPHWKWEIVLYFWLGGIAAGAYAIAAVADLFGDEHDRATVKAGRLIALPLMLVCPVLLVKDLGRPGKFLHMLRVFKLKSPMSAGSWGLFCFGGASGLSAVLELVSPGDRWRNVRRAVGLVGGPLATFVGGYTGVLLAATAVPLWARNRLLWGPVFLTSAFSTGLAAIEIAVGLRGGQQRALAKLERLHVLGVCLEIGLLIASFKNLGPTGHLLTRGKWSTLFLPGTVGLGLGVPLILELVSPRRSGRMMTLVKAACILVGGLVLRTCLVYGGKDSADDPHAYFALTGSDAR